MQAQPKLYIYVLNQHLVDYLGAAPCCLPVRIWVKCLSYREQSCILVAIFQRLQTLTLDATMFTRNRSKDPLSLGSQISLPKEEGKPWAMVAELALGDQIWCPGSETLTQGKVGCP